MTLWENSSPNPQYSSIYILEPKCSSAIFQTSECRQSAVINYLCCKGGDKQGVRDIKLPYKYLGMLTRSAAEQGKWDLFFLPVTKPHFPSHSAKFSLNQPSSVSSCKSHSCKSRQLKLQREECSLPMEMSQPVACPSLFPVSQNGQNSIGFMSPHPHLSSAVSTGPGMW